MVRYYLTIWKIVNALTFIWVLFIFFAIFDFDAVLRTAENELVLIDVLDSLKNVLIYVFYFAFFSISNFIALLSAFLNPTIYFFMIQFVTSFFSNFLSLWFPFPKAQIPEGQVVPAFSQIPDLIISELLVLTTDIYLLIFQILFVISIIYFIRAIYRHDPKMNFIAIGSLILMIVIPLMVFGLRDMLDLFNLVDIFNSLGLINLNELANPLNPIMRNLPINDFFAFISSPVALFAILCYLYLELSFQANYINEVTKPTLERRDRLEAQLNLIRKESVLITTNIDKIREEAKKRKEELKVEEKETVGKLFAQTGERFSYVKEMIERKKLETEEKKLITAASKTRRLGRYIDRLFREDSEAEATITATTSAPRAKNLVLSTIADFIIRFILLIIISFVVIHPQFFFINVFRLPPALIESVAMYSPEIIIILLLPIMIVFPAIAQAISYVKHRNLIIRLKQEGRIKEILASVGDYVKVEEAEEEEEGKETEVGEIATETA